MASKYVPIIRWKRGEQNALLNLLEDVKDLVTPFIEIPFTPTAEKNIARIDTIWSGRQFYFYLCPDWYEDEPDTYKFYMEKIQSTNCDTAIPVFDLSNDTDIRKSAGNTPNGVAIRIQNNEFGLIEDTLNGYVAEGVIDPDQTDLLLDLRYVYENDLFSKESVIKATFADLEGSQRYRSIIISSCSFPKSFTNLESDRVYSYRRTELQVYHLADKLAKRHGFNYIYSDYGPSDLEEVEFVVGMTPNFKIKYTTLDQYLYIKGKSLKKGGLDLEEVGSCCKLLVDRADFSGEGFSWGDDKIYELASGKASSGGNLTSWVGYSYNHHISLIAKLI